MSMRDEPIVSPTALCDYHKGRFSEPCVACDLELRERQLAAQAAEITALKAELNAPFDAESIVAAVAVAVGPASARGVRHHLVEREQEIIELKAEAEALHRVCDEDRAEVERLKETLRLLEGGLQVRAGYAARPAKANNDLAPLVAVVKAARQYFDNLGNDLSALFH